MASIAQQIDIPGLIADGRFQRRPLSWVCSLDDYWIKIPRKSSSISADTRDASVHARALKQFEDTRRLRALDDRILAPLELDDHHACLIYRRLAGPDLHAAVLAAQSTEQIAPALREAIELCARLHRIPEDDERLAGLARHDYLADSVCPVGGALAEEVRVHAHTVVVGGMLVRNYMWDREGGDLYFFDPHGVFLGIPEEDVARFLLALVMATWGRGTLRWRVWEHFNPDELIGHYETVSGRKLSPTLLRYGMDLHVARRWRYANKSVSSMRWWMKAPAQVWGTQYFKQVRRWRKKHGI